jgi:uncharacterized protein (TIGR02145 family)
MKKIISYLAMIVLLLACSKTENPLPKEEDSQSEVTAKPSTGSGGGGNNILTVTTYKATNISRFNATVGGSVSKSGGGSQVTQYGVCYNTSPAPTTSDYKVILGSGYGSFSGILSGLSPTTTYYVRAYAVKDNITFYGNEINFTTLATNFGYYGEVTDIDGNVYNAVTIGSQVWLVENLKTTRYRDGTPIPYGTGNWWSLATGAYCNYNDNEAYTGTYGRLYNWYAVNDPRNIAPMGWHVATDNDWIALLGYFGGMYVAAGNLKEYGTAHWQEPNLAFPNDGGFNALPGGYRSVTLFGGIGMRGSWWSSSDYPGTVYGKYIRMHYSEQNTMGSFGTGDSQGWNDKHYGYSVRCVKN